MKNKKIIIFIFILCFALLASTNNAGAVVVVNSLDQPLGNPTLTGFFQSILGHIQGVIAFLSVLFIVIGGIIYIISSGNQKMAELGKACIVAALVGLALAAAGPSFLKQIKLAVYDDVDAAIVRSLDQAPTVSEIVERVLSFLLSIVGMLGIIGLTVSGAMYIFSHGNSSQMENAKRAMISSLLGVTIAGASLILVKQIISFF